MNTIKAQQWYQSAEIGYVDDEGILTFQVSEEQKEYMESHMDEVDEKLKNKMLGIAPHTIRFEPFWDGEEDAYYCEVYWD